MITLNIRPICWGLIAVPISRPSAENAAAPSSVTVSNWPPWAIVRASIGPMMRRAIGRTKRAATRPCTTPATTFSSATSWIGTGAILADREAAVGDAGGEDTDRGGLAGAVRPEEPEELPGRDLEVQALERHDHAGASVPPSPGGGRIHLSQGPGLDRGERHPRERVPATHHGAR